MADNNIHSINFNVKMNSIKGVVTYLETSFNGEKEVLIKDGSMKTVSQASEEIRKTLMNHKSERYSRYL
jgi:hypothetical protein